MCGRFFRHGVTWEEYSAGLSLVPPDNVAAPEATYNAAPMSIQPVIRRMKDNPFAPRGYSEGALEMVPLLWSLIPSWWRKPLSEKQFTSFNARIETIAHKPVFRGAFRHHRCLVPMSGYYEWTGEKGHKSPYAIGLRNRRWFCVAGLWDSAIIDGSEVESFAIVTTKANIATASLHARMPVIIAPQDYTKWLDPNVRDMQAFAEPIAPEDTDFWPVGREVGNVRNNHPDLILPPNTLF